MQVHGRLLDRPGRPGLAFARVSWDRAPYYIQAAGVGNPIVARTAFGVLHIHDVQATLAANGFRMMSAFYSQAGIEATAEKAAKR
jgi:hypothetical protein